MAKANTDALVDDIEATRQRLTVNVDQLVERVNPKNLVKQKMDDIKARFVADDGSPRLETIVPVAAGACGVVVLVVTVRRLLR